MRPLTLFSKEQILDNLKYWEHLSILICSRNTYRPRTTFPELNDELKFQELEPTYASTPSLAKYCVKRVFEVTSSFFGRLKKLLKLTFLLGLHEGQLNSRWTLKPKSESLITWTTICFVQRSGNFNLKLKLFSFLAHIHLLPKIF